MNKHLVTGAFTAILLCSAILPAIAAEDTSAAPSKRELFVACLNEAERVDGKVYAFQAPSRGHSAPRIPDEVYQAKELCRQMRDSQDSAQGKSAQVAAADSCGASLSAYAAQHPNDKGHIQAMQSLCQKMTGEHVALNGNPASFNAVTPASGDEKEQGSK